MATLEIRLFGSLEVSWGKRPVSELRAKKTLALLAFLCVESDQPHRREKLANMLWPDSPDPTARGNLRHALSELKKTFQDRDASLPFFLTTRETIQFNADSDVWIDVDHFISELKTKPQQADSSQYYAKNLKEVEAALNLYRGPFLEGFSLPDNYGFEEWLLVTREYFQRLAVRARQDLIEIYQSREEYTPALEHAWTLIDLDPWREKTHRQLMRLLAYTGQRGAALAQFEICQQMLAKELHVKPGEKTKALYQKIRNGDVGEKPALSKSVPDQSPPQLFFEKGHPISEVSSPFVARERELSQLVEHLQQALSRDCHLAFVTGEAGSGKTALLKTFSHLAMEKYPDLIVVQGKCSAKIGFGDPYLPFRQILDTLTGDIQSRWMAGAISSNHARRLWENLPLVVQILSTKGKGLLDTFISSSALIERCKSWSNENASWIQDLQNAIEENSAGPEAPGGQPANPSDLYTGLLRELSIQKPLLLILDDLQWGDAGSIELFFHLSRELKASRILMVGVYRPEEIAAGRGSGQHPLLKIIPEIKRDLGDIEIDLGQADHWAFQEAYLDTEPNMLDSDFRKTLFQQTGGLPLYTVEVLRGLQERGDLKQDENGNWIEGTDLKWEDLPVRVEGIIAERIGRLPEIMQRILRTACVEGEEFTAEVVADILGIGEEEIIPLLSGDLDRRHRLVIAKDIHRIGDQRISTYQFRHILYQKYLFDALDDVELVLLHEQVGKSLESLYGEQNEGIVVSLAHHYQKAGINEKALHYLAQAGDQAVKVTANQEAISHYTQALKILSTLPASVERDQQELRLVMSLIPPLMVTHGFANPELANLCNQAKNLCAKIGSTPWLFPVLFHLGSYYCMRAKYITALEFEDQMFALADQFEDPELAACAHFAYGYTDFRIGELEEGCQHLEQVISFYDSEEHHHLAYRYGTDPGIGSISWASWVLWLLGYPDQAQELSQRSLTLARQVSRPADLALALGVASYFHLLRKELTLAEASMGECGTIAAEHGFPNWLAALAFMRGWALLESDRSEKALAQLQQAFQIHQDMGFRDLRSVLLAQLAQAQGRAGQIKTGLETFGSAVDFVEESCERFFEPELIRMQGELLEMDGQQGEAEKAYQKAIKTACQQRAKIWELRATMSLCLLRQKQGMIKEAHQELSEIYGWFSEGFDTPDLQRAKELLKDLT